MNNDNAARTLPLGSPGAVTSSPGLPLTNSEDQVGELIDRYERILWYRESLSREDPVEEIEMAREIIDLYLAGELKPAWPKKFKAAQVMLALNCEHNVANGVCGVANELLGDILAEKEKNKNFLSSGGRFV